MGEIAGPALIVLDDLHFADEGTVAVVVRLASECRRRPWLVLALFRPGEGARALHAAATELVAQGVARLLDLAPLSPAGVGALVAAVRGEAAAADRLAAIVAESGGIPWFVETLARGGGAVTALRDRVLLRLDRLEAATPGANAVLAALAPATRALAHTVVAELCGGDSRDLCGVLVRLRDASVLVDSRDGWAFRDELLRRSLMEGMILADQQDAHRTLAETLERRGGHPAELAMHFAAAEDDRAGGWSVVAGEHARASDAHTEALAQFEQALRFLVLPDQRRKALTLASLEAYHLGRFAESQRLAEDALAIAGDTPEARSLLHQRAANSARLHGDFAGAGAHMDAAEAVLADQPTSYQKAFVATGRVLQAVVRGRPEGVVAAAERALAMARELGDGAEATRITVEVRAHLLLTLIDSGDPAAFILLEEILALGGQTPRRISDLVVLRLNAYTGAVVAMFHADAARLRTRLEDDLRRHELGWAARADVYHALELVQRGAYAEARAVLAATPAPAAGSMEEGMLLGATALLEVRTGTVERARALLGDASVRGGNTKTRALLSLVRLEVAELARDGDAAERAAALYATAERFRHVRIAGVAAVALARTGTRVRPLEWLVEDAPACVLWSWAGALVVGDTAALAEAASRLTASDLPYEAALARRDAGDLSGAYRALAALEAGTARTQTAEALRAAEQPIPRRTRAAIEQDGLTETEREVCHLVVRGARNDDIAGALVISVRTIQAHLGHIYQKTGVRGRVALAAWARAHGITGE